MKCENCDEECWRDSADVGVGVIYGPWGCPCGWSESEEYNQLTGPKKTEQGGIADQYGVVTPPASETLLSALIKSGDEFRVDGKNGQSFGRVRRRQFEEGAVPVQPVVNIKTLTDGINKYTGPTLVLPLPKCKDGGEHGPWADNYTYCIACGYYDKSRAEDEFCHDGKQAYPGCTCDGCQAWRKSPANFFAGPADPWQDFKDPAPIPVCVMAQTAPAFQIVGYARTKDLAPLLDEAQPGGSYISIGLDHPTCWMEDTPYEHLEPLYRGTPPVQTTTVPVGNQVNEDLKAAYEMGFLAATQRFTPFTTVDYTESQDYIAQRRSDLKELVSYDRSLD